MNERRIWILVWAAVLLAGFGLGRWSASPNAVPQAGAPGSTAVRPNAVPSPTPLPECTPAPVPECPEPAAGLAEAAAPRGPGRQLIDDSRAALARYVFDAGGAPEQAADFLIGQLSDEQLVGVIAGMTNLTEHDLSGVRDPREFASRLSSVVMDGVLRDPVADETPGEAVEFATRVTPFNAPDEPSTDFEAGTRRIYAVFPSDGYREDTVMVKWYRSDQPELLMFKKHPIQTSDDQSYVWLEPTGGWSAGDYRVEFYTNDDRLGKIASGDYSVR